MWAVCSMSITSRARMLEKCMERAVFVLEKCISMRMAVAEWWALHSASLPCPSWASAFGGIGHGRTEWLCRWPLCLWVCCPRPRRCLSLSRPAEVQMYHNLAHGDLLGYGVLDMGMGMGCGRSRVQFIPGWVWSVGAIVTGLLPYSLLPYSMREADRAMVSAGVLIATGFRPRSCPGCQDLTTFINVWK